jgi:hypothetical protein
MSGRKVLQKRSCSNEDDGTELYQRDETEEHFFKTLLRFLIEDVLTELQNDGIVDKIEEEKVKDDAPADFLAGSFDDGTIRGLSDERMHSDPWKNLVYVCHVATIVGKVGASQENDDHGRRCDNCSVDVH